MKLSDFLSPERVLANIESTTKKDALKEISEFVSSVEKEDVLSAKHTKA